MSNKHSLRNYLINGVGGLAIYNFYDWFCKDSSLPGKQKKLDVKVRKLALSTKIDIDKMYVWYKNNCPLNGSLYDDIRFSDVDTDDVIYTIIPKSGHKSNNGRAEVWGKENDFKEPLVTGSWNDVLKFFGVKKGE